MGRRSFELYQSRRSDAASSLHINQGNSYSDWEVPLNDIFGSTIAVLDTNLAQIANSYTYDPNGKMTLGGPLGGSSSRGPWGFLYQGLENEVPDAPKLYWEPNGNIYNPDPFQLSPNGPEGLGGGGGGGFPRGLGGPGGGSGGLPLFVQNDLNQSGAVALDASALLSDSPAWPVAVGLQIFAQFFPDLFGGGEPSISVYDVRHTQRGAHQVYCGELGTCDPIVTQQGNITLAQAKFFTEGEPGGGGGPGPEGPAPDVEMVLPGTAAQEEVQIPRLVSNPKHNPNSMSPEPSNVQELFNNSIEDENGVRWSKDKSGTIHRFSRPSNGETHWNGSTAGPNPIRENNIPAAIRRALR